MRRARTFPTLLAGSLALVAVLSADLCAQDRRIQQKLEETIVSFTFTDQPLQEAIDFLGTLGGVNIVLDRRQADAGQTVTLKLTNVALETAMKFITEQVELRYIIRDGLIFVSDEEGTRQEPVTRVYDVNDLLVQPPDFEGPAMELQNLSGSGRSGSSSNIGIFGGTDDTDNETENSKTREEMLEELIALIQEVIEPGTWNE